MKMKQKSQSKLVVAMSAVILLLVALSATLTFAYFTANKESSETSISFGQIKITGNDLAIAQVETGKIVPGDSVKVSGSATLESNVNTFYRVKLAAESSDAGLNLDALINDIFANTYFKGKANMTYNDADKTYYGFIAKNADAQSTAILDYGTDGATIIFTAANYDNSWQNVTVTLTITVQAIQADHLTKDYGTDVSAALTAGLASDKVWATAGAQANAK